METPEVELLPWDSNWLGYPVARFEAGPGDDPAGVARGIAQCQAAGVRLLYLVLEPVAAEAAATAQAAGAWLADARHQYALALPEPAAAPALAPATQLAKAAALTPALRDLARASGALSRFRLDERIGWAAYCALYDQWLLNSLAKNQVWESTAAGATTGLLALDGDGPVARIGLLAVAAAARGRGLGRALVQQARRVAQQQGFAQLQVATQGRNLPARHLYELCGFQLLQVRHWYHLWL